MPYQATDERRAEILADPEVAAMMAMFPDAKIRVVDLKGNPRSESKGNNGTAAQRTAITTAAAGRPGTIPDQPKRVWRSTGYLTRRGRNGGAPGGSQGA